MPAPAARIAARIPPALASCAAPGAAGVAEDADGVEACVGVEAAPGAADAPGAAAGGVEATSAGVEACELGAGVAATGVAATGVEACELGDAGAFKPRSNNCASCSRR